MKFSRLIPIVSISAALLFFCGSNCGGVAGGITLQIDKASLGGGMLDVKNEDISKATLEIRDDTNNVVHMVDITEALKTGQPSSFSVDFSQIKDFDSKKLYRFASIIEGVATNTRMNFTFNGVKMPLGAQFPFKTEKMIDGVQKQAQFDMGVSYTFGFLAQKSEIFGGGRVNVEVYLGMSNFNTKS